MRGWEGGEARGDSPSMAAYELCGGREPGGIVMGMLVRPMVGSGM